MHMHRALLLGLALAGLCSLASAGSGKDTWGQDTLTNYPPGQGRKTVPVQAGDDGNKAPVALKCACSDADPRDPDTAAITYDCFYQRYFGNCNEAFMFDANAELAPEGFCQISCSRCNCCTPVYDLLRSLNATRFLQALEVASPSLKEMLQHPGYTATVLVPSNQAFDAALEKYRDLFQRPDALQELLKFHILPPEPVRRGLWTSPLLSLGPTLYTAYDGPRTLSVQRFALPAGTTAEGGLAGFAIDGPFNSATVLRSDVPACKSFVTVIDAVLLPFDPARPPTPDYLAGGAVLGALQCGVQPNALVRGRQLVAGDANRLASIGLCCDSCQRTAGCNAFRYCSQKGGCRQPDRSLVPYGACALLHSEEAAAGQAPAYDDFSSLTVPLASGFILTPAGAAGGAGPTAETDGEEGLPALPAIKTAAAAGGGRRRQLLAA